MPEDNIQQSTQPSATPSLATPNRQDQAARTQGPQESVIKSEKPQANGMFIKLTDLSFKRDLKQAIGFYIAYLLLLIILSAVLGGVYALATGQDSLEAGVTFGTTIAIVSSLVLSFAIIFKKNLLTNYLFIVVALLSGVIAFIGGGLLGLIPAAFLSTK